MAAEAVLVGAEADAAGNRETLAAAECVARHNSLSREPESDIALPEADIAGDAEALLADEVGVLQRQGDRDAARQLAQGAEDLPAVGGEMTGRVGGRDFQRAALR